MVSEGRGAKRLLSVVTTTDPAAGGWRQLAARLEHCRLPEGWKLELVLVDDLKQWPGKTEAARELEAIPCPVHTRIIWYPERRGQLAAIMSGVNTVRGDAVLTLDPDMHGILGEIPAMLERLSQGCSIVHGYRVSRTGLGLVRRVGSALANATVRWLAGIRVPDIGSPVTLFSTSLLPSLKEIPGDIGNPRLFFYRSHARQLCAHPLPDTGTGGPSHYRTRDLVLLYLRLPGACLRIRRALPGRGE